MTKPTTKAHLSGLSVPSVKDLVDRCMATLPSSGMFDFGHPLQRERIRKTLHVAFDRALMELSPAFEKAQEKAVRHVFSLMRDADYQEKRAAQRKKRLQDKIQRATEQKRAEVEKVANNLRSQIVAVKKPKETVN